MSLVPTSHIPDAIARVLNQLAVSYSYKDVCNHSLDDKWSYNLDTLLYLPIEMFKQIKGKALEGSLTISFDVKVSKERDKVSLYLASVIFVKLHIKTEPELTSQYNAKDSIHSNLCASPTMKVNCSWKPNNRHLNPKPQLTFAPLVPSYLIKLNQQRLDGTDPNLMLVQFGSHQLKMHLFVLKDFVPFVKDGTGNKEDGYSFLSNLNLSKAMVNDLVNYMYTRQLDFSAHQVSEVLELLSIGDQLLIPNLFVDALTYIFKIADQLTGRDTLLLLYKSYSSNSKELKQFCSWLVTTKPEFYEEILAKGATFEEVLMLLKVAYREKLKRLNKKLDQVWVNRLEIHNKIWFMNTVCSRNDKRLVILIDEKASATLTTLAKDDPKYLAFSESYKILHEKASDYEA